jgi:CII-binding regulator of phage lambda lysogenization HflD
MRVDNDELMSRSVSIMAVRGVVTGSMAALRSELIGSSAETVRSTTTSYTSSTVRWQQVPGGNAAVLGGRV